VAQASVAVRRTAGSGRPALLDVYVNGRLLKATVQTTAAAEADGTG